MMIKTDVSILYKTKMCKKYSTNGYCPYGMRCQFIHEVAEPHKQAQQPEVKKDVSKVKDTSACMSMNVNCQSF